MRTSFGLRAAWLPLAALVAFAAPAQAAGSLETRYATIRYAEESQLNDFLWRITGSRPDPGEEAAGPVKSRVDELVERVQSLLDMYPGSLRFAIEITPKAGEKGPPAFYRHGTRTVYVSSSTVTDGILAHEIAHAVICAQFTPPPPDKAQEILARYVDENLWSEV